MDIARCVQRVAYADTHSDTDANPYTYAYSNTHSNTHPDADTYAYSNTHPDADTYAHSNTNADTQRFRVQSLQGHEHQHELEYLRHADGRDGYGHSCRR
ncbi:hypothetical protein GCM10007901_32480 [Dyella acidisoli]|uniref:Uncharacterized protein n=1 Tax=Dyella acidisoli TaxID=1867834 RepID=A0ABQ5XRC2_9GAMM|nr:hypothetical protein GCM10007901_32480 [Dyella acidisoli]